jgi:hypothetical protein
LPDLKATFGQAVCQMRQVLEMKEILGSALAEEESGRSQKVGA